MSLPGHPEGQALDRVADLAAWLAGELGDLPGPIALVGHSLGGAVALQAALDHPGLADGLVLVATGARLPVPRHAFDRLREDFDAECERMVRESWAGDHEELIRRGADAVRSLGPDTLLADYTAANDFDVRERLGEVALPVLVVSGADDPLTPPWLGEELARGLPVATMALVAGAAHVPQLEQAPAVDLLVAAYLARLELTLEEG